MRLIDADSLKYRRKDYSGYDDVSDEERKRGILFLLKSDITSAQTIDPLKHGKWNDGQCTQCGFKTVVTPFAINLDTGEKTLILKFCSNCGARMDGGEE